MGAGASTGVTIKAARANEEKAEELFNGIDGNKDSKLSLVEMYNEVQKHGENIQQQWSLDYIKEALARFDADNDGTR